MKTVFPKIRKGSALLVAILVMGILLTLTLGLSALVIREIRQTGDIVAAGKAFYAAEAGVENALLNLHENLPGYQTKNLKEADDEGWIENEDESLNYRYRIRNQGDTYPYFDADQPVYLNPGIGITKKYLYDTYPKSTYNILGLNQTVTIPLFVACGDGNFKDVKNFVLQYYVDFDLDLENLFAGKIAIQDFDILRWKLFGEPIVPDDTSGITRTHAISDFYPAHGNDGPDQPVCIGSDIDLVTERCFIPVAQQVDSETNVTGDILDKSWSFARECYTKDAGLGVGVTLSESGIQKGCSIKNFMDTHKKNYLTITNVVNPDIIGIDDAAIRTARANIYYRIVTRKNDTLQPLCPGETASDEDVMVREAAAISSDGFANGGKVKQSIDVQLKLNSFLPVFNFTLFRTDPSEPNPEDKVVESSISL